MTHLIGTKHHYMSPLEKLENAHTIYNNCLPLWNEGLLTPDEWLDTKKHLAECKLLVLSE